MILAITALFTAMLQHLQWANLQLRRKISKLQTFFRIIHQEYTPSIPSYFTPMKKSIRLYHPKHFILPDSSTYAHQNSFYPKTLRNWNNLPSNMIELNNLLTKFLNTA